MERLAGNAECKLFKFLQMFSLYLSTFVLVLIGVDRFVVVKYPIKSLNTAKRLDRLIVLVWVLSLILKHTTVSLKIDRYMMDKEIFLDAEDAVHARDGYEYDGYRLSVEVTYGGEPEGFRESGEGGGRDRGAPARRSQYRVLVSDVFKDGIGVVEFLRYLDMKYAVKKLDDSRFRSHEGEVSYFRVKEDYVEEGSSGRRRDPWHKIISYILVIMPYMKISESESIKNQICTVYNNNGD
ncbi:hypothetical protein C0J52_27598 [Blattella germanica]|nr:hypothetical protein C0J52_27598 [Blattella germanica]